MNTLKQRLVGNMANEMAGLLGDRNFALFLKILYFCMHLVEKLLIEISETSHVIICRLSSRRSDNPFQPHIFNEMCFYLMVLCL